MRAFSNLGLALIMPFVATGAVVATGGAATAADCSVTWRDHSAGWDTVRSGQSVKAGPNAACATTGTGSGRYRWTLHCWVFSDAGRVFWHGTGPDGTGWVFEGNLAYNNNVRNYYNNCSTR